MNAPTRPVMRYHGGKWRLAPWLIAMFPPHRIYVEPFGGAASVLMQKPRSYGEVYNDRESEIVNVFRVLQNPTSALELMRLLELTPFSRDEFESAYIPSEDPIIRARNMIVRAFMGFGSAAMTRTYKTGFRSNSNRSGTTPAHDWANWPAHVPSFVDRLRGVVIENRGALEVMRQHDSPDTLHYVDPPYVWDTRTSMGKGNKKHSYAYEMDDEDHCQLADVLRHLQGMVFISGYPCELYDHHLYPDWRRIERKHFADGARERTEVVWLNPAAAAQLKSGNFELFGKGGYNEQPM